MKLAKKLVLVMLLVASVAYARKRDPLTEAEADKLRQVAMEPQKRLKLYIEFTQARLDSIEQLRADPKEAEGRGAKIHDLLGDFTSLIDEINDNLDQYQARALDQDQAKQFRKGLKEVNVAEERFRARLRTLRHEIEVDPQTKAESKDYTFALQDAEDALKSSMEMSKEYLQEKSEEKPVDKKK